MIDTDFNDVAFFSWLAGFADGEACFDLGMQIKGKGHPYITPRFAIRLRDDDSAILYECQQRCGLGTVVRRGFVQNKGGILTRPSSTWQVSGCNSCMGIVRIFDRFPLRAKKAKDFAVWRMAVITMCTMPRANRWHGRNHERDATLQRLKFQLQEGRAYG